MALASNSNDIDDAKELFSMINQRLEAMKDVAAYKYYNQMPSFIPGREQHIFADVKRVCDANGLEVEGVQLFVESQMRTAINIQNGWRKHWNKTEFTEDHIRDLENQIRPELSSLTDDIIRKIRIVLPTLQNPDNYLDLKIAMDEMITADYVTAEQKQGFLDSLIKIKRKA